MNRVKQLSALSPYEWRLLLAASVMLPVTALWLRLRGMQKARAGLARIPGFRDVPEDDALVEARRAARMVNAAAGHGLYRANCLKRCLVLEWFLARRGIACELKIGATREGEEFGAHAWVECRGEVLNDRADVGERFGSFDR